MYTEVMPYFMKKLREHEHDFDPAAPRDYLDYLLLENETDGAKFSIQSIVGTLFGIYLGANDTVVAAMRWLCLGMYQLIK